jgi:hypothetical protein
MPVTAQRGLAPSHALHHQAAGAVHWWEQPSSGIVWMWCSDAHMHVCASCSACHGTSIAL